MERDRHGTRPLDESPTVVYVEGSIGAQSTDDDAVNTPFAGQFDIPCHDVPFVIAEDKITTPRANEHVYRKVRGSFDALDHCRRRCRAPHAEGLTQLDAMRTGLLRRNRACHRVDTDFEP